MFKSPAEEYIYVRNRRPSVSHKSPEELTRNVRPGYKTLQAVNKRVEEPTRIDKREEDLSKNIHKDPEYPIDLHPYVRRDMMRWLKTPEMLSPEIRKHVLDGLKRVKEAVEEAMAKAERERLQVEADAEREREAPNIKFNSESPAQSLYSFDPHPRYELYNQFGNNPQHGPCMQLGNAPQLGSQMQFGNNLQLGPHFQFGYIPQPGPYVQFGNVPRVYNPIQMECGCLIVDHQLPRLSEDIFDDLDEYVGNRR